MLNRKTPLAVLVALGGVGDADVDPRREPHRHHFFLHRRFSSLALF